MRFYKKSLSMALAFGSVAFTGNLLADEGGNTANFWADYNFYLLSEDNKQTLPSSASGDSAPNSTMYMTGNAYVGMTTKLKDGEFNFYYALSSAIRGEGVGVEVATYTTSLMDKLTFNVGYMYAHTGGFDQKDYTFDEIYTSPYAAGMMPFGGSVSAMEFVYDTGFGNVALQLADDSYKLGGGAYRTDDDGTENKDAMNGLAFILEYEGDFNGIKPLFQYAPYNAGKSSTMNVGLGYDTDMLSVHFDYLMDSRFITKEVTNDISNMKLRVTGTFGSVMPFLVYNAFDVKQGGTDAKGNSVSADDGSMEINDNETAIAAGVGYQLKETTQVYLQYNMLSYKTIESDATEKTRDGGQFLMGFTGTI